MGAKVSVSACGQEYIRNIGSTSSAFSHSLNNLAHVGIGTCNSVEKVVVTWSNLESSSIQNPQINTVVNVGN